MILAAVEGHTSPELELWRDCKTFNALPDVGGARDQEYGLLRRMRIISGYAEAWQSWQGRTAGKEAEWIERNPDGWRIVQQIMEMRNGK